MKLPKPGAKAPSFYSGVISQGLKALLPRINAGAPTPSSYVDFESARELSPFADQIDRGVESLVAGEPSSHFNSRLRARIAEEAATPRFNWRARTPIAAGAVALAILLVAFIIRTPRANSPNIAHQNAPPVATSTANPSAPAPVVSAENHPLAMTPHLRSSAPKHTASHSEPDVIVERGQMAAALQFADALRSGRIDGPQLVTAEEQLVAPLEIKPIEITPLSPPQREIAPAAPTDPTRP